MIDIHCHILHNIDDGPSSLADAEQMLRVAAKDGIQEIIATPHFSNETLININTRLDELTPMATQCGIKLHSGCEYRLADLSDESQPPLTLAKSMFILVDLNNSYIPQFMKSLAFDFSLKGYRIILAHPEKLLSPSSIPQMIDLHQHGVFFQVNAASINGKSGKTVKHFAQKIIASGICDYIASDAHSLGYRSFELQQAKSQVTESFGRTIAELAFEINPQLLLQNIEPESMPFKRKSVFASIKQWFAHSHKTNS
ncbi:MAG: tyrosine-protein phosphatase [Victivallaceae bacterium]